MWSVWAYDVVCFGIRCGVFGHTMWSVLAYDVECLGIRCMCLSFIAATGQDVKLTNPIVAFGAEQIFLEKVGETDQYWHFYLK